MLLVLDVLLIVFYYSLLRDFFVYLSLYSMYVTMSISIGLYPNLDLWNANKLHYITLLMYCTGCPTTYQTRQFFNNFTTNEDIATKFEADLRHCVGNVTTS